jgi:hypothetical protein
MWPAYVVAVLITWVAACPIARADDPPLDLNGSWQSNGSCSPDITATQFLVIAEDLGTGTLTASVGPDCGTAFLDGRVRRLSACEPTPTPLPGQVSGTSVEIPPSGYYLGRAILETPYPSFTFGCVDPPLAGFVDIETHVTGTIEAAAGRATRIAGTWSFGHVRGINTLGDTCFTTDLGGAVGCTFVMLRNEVATGSNQTVEPYPDATVTFADVTTAGTVGVTPLPDPAGDLPPNFALLGVPVFYDITTTATVTGPITVCLGYPDADGDGLVDGTSPPLDEDELMILHEEDGTFVDRTASRDPAANRICAVVTSLSQFVLGAPVLSPTTTTTTIPPLAGQPLAGTRLVLQSAPRRRMSVLSKEGTLGLGTGIDPTASGGQLRIATAAGDGFDVVHALPAGGWRAIARSGETIGYEYTDASLAAGPVRRLVLKAGGALKAVGVGEGLGYSLGQDPDPVTLTVEVGGSRYCMRFGGERRFIPGRRFVAHAAPPPTSCP